jgi:uncharacterized membrane protein
MEDEHHIIDKKLQVLLEKGQLEISDKNFENKVMNKVFYAYQQVEQQKKSIRLAWLFLSLSAVFFPIGILSFLQKMNINLSDILGRNLENSQQFIAPAVVLIFCILLLLQIDNLFRLTLRTRFS